MPAPPPPPPPPVAANFLNQRPKMTENRATLLNEIHRGARLKKTVRFYFINKFFIKFVCKRILDKNELLI